MMNVWPLQRDCPAFYGRPNTPNWLHQNTVDVACPWPLRMDGVAVSHILIHKNCSESLARVLNVIWDKLGRDINQIEAHHYDRYSGSYNYRPMRGGSTLSMHAYAAAIDWDAEENEQHSQKHLFQETSLIVTAFKEEGWVWGGDWSAGSIDAMHFQAARVHA